ncbi:hypothetical protein [Microcoleus sp. D2_18a_D3]|uniref:hypothetical protein n=1 Tax=Microcoleus sp. D2_18a_D3 TaxID=3055330 RepID=UPI002FD04BB3
MLVELIFRQHGFGFQPLEAEVQLNPQILISEQQLFGDQRCFWLIEEWESGRLDN